VIPVPENEPTAPFTKFVPVAVTSIVVPRWPLVGDTDETVGVGRVTSKQAAHVSDCVSGFVRMTSRALTGADGEMVMLTAT
jgi:hypothetical protein